MQLVLVLYVLSMACSMRNSFLLHSKNFRTHRFLTNYLSTATPLSYDTSKPDKSVPNASVLFLHGILGSKKNWRTPSHEFIKLHSNFQSITVDHRGHGSSPTIQSSPNTVASCADDIITLLDSLQHIPLPEIVCAHSFSGKVALVYLKKCIELNRPLPRHTWILDAVPGVHDTSIDTSQHQSVANIINILASLPGEFHSKDWMSKHLVSKGFPISVALWLCMNVIPANVNNGGSGQGLFKFSFHIQTIVELFADYCALDLWEFLEEFRQLAPEDSVGVGAQIHFIRAGKNHVWTADVLHRFHDLTDHADSNVRLHTMSHVGHWLHSDDLPGTLDIISKHSGLQPVNKHHHSIHV